MEGMHLDPSLYLYEFARFGQAHLKSGSLYNSDSNSAGAQRPDPASIPLEEGSSPSNAATEADDGDLLRYSSSPSIVKRTIMPPLLQ